MARKRLPPAPPKKDRPTNQQSPGAPPLDISVDEVRALARLGHSGPEIAEFFQCDTGTIYRRVSAHEINALRRERPRKLKEALFARALGGKIERLLPDGSKEITYIRSSDRMMELAMKYLVGEPPKVIELNPNGERPAHVAQTVDPGVLKDAVKVAIEELESEY